MTRREGKAMTIRRTPYQESGWQLIVGVSVLLADASLTFADAFSTLRRHGEETAL
jgi:hypothetical protein